MAKKQKLAQKRGPKPKPLIIEGGWEKAVKKAIGKQRPVKGWPKDKK